MEKIKMEPKEFWEDQKWGFKHYSELVRKYPDQWVAIRDKKVVASGDLAEVELEAKRKTGKEDIPVIFVESGSHIYRLRK
jgi:hypothetical protein